MAKRGTGYDSSYRIVREILIQRRWKCQVIPNFPPNMADQLCSSRNWCSVLVKCGVPRHSSPPADVSTPTPPRSPAVCELGSELCVESNKNQVPQGQKRRLKICYVYCNLSDSQQLIRHIDGLQIGLPGFDSRQCKNFLFYIASRQSLGPTYPSIQWVLGVFLLG
jgi:hypothetical protein